MEFELGQTYCGYKFLDVVKRSKTGVEYRVQNTLAQRMELLKVLPSGAQDDQEETDRFMREMRVRARLVHPNIVAFFTAMPLEGRLVMTTELVEGLPLSERLQLGPVPWREAVGFGRQILSAVNCAHEQKIIHRDITPDNIIAIPGGAVKLTNFRLAKPIHSLNLTQSGAIIGNVRYISPEQVKGTGNLDHRSDLYSIGIVVYEMLAGRTPFHSTSQFEVMLAHVNQQPEPPSRFMPSVPPGLDAIILRALAKSPAQRYQSAREFADALDGLTTASHAAPAAAVVEAVVPAPVAEEPAVPAPPAVEAVEVVAAPLAEVSAPEPEPVAIAEEPSVPTPQAVEAVEVVAAPLAEAPAPAPEPVAVAEEPPVPTPPAVEAVEVVAAPLAEAPEPEPVAVAEELSVSTPEAVEVVEVVAAPLAELPAPEPEPVAAVVAVEPAPVLEPVPAAEPVAVEEGEKTGQEACAPLLAETAVHANLWTAAEIVSRAAASDVQPSSAPAMVAEPQAAIPLFVPLSQPGPAAPVSTTTLYDAPGFLAAAKTKSESIQWAVFGGTAAFLGAVWVTIWLVTGK